MIYFIKQGQYVKIGYTENLSRRVKELQTASPQPLKVLLTIPGSRETEKALHSFFSSKRVNGEWLHYGSLNKVDTLANITEAADRKYSDITNLKELIDNSYHYFLLKKSKRSKKLRDKIRQYGVEN